MSDPMTPDPTVERREKNALKRALVDDLERSGYLDPGYEHGLSHWLVYHQGTPSLVAAVGRILAARAAAPDALRVALEAMAAEWERQADERPAMPRRHIAQLRALLEDGA